MDTLQYILLAIAFIVFIGPKLFADTSPIPETSGNIHKVTSLAELNALLSSTTYVLIDFYADWCPPCRAIAPHFSKWADEHAVKGKLAFAKVNVDHVKDVAGKYDIRAMPTFLVLKDGKVEGVTVGGKSVEMVKGADVGLLKGVVQALSEEVKA